MAEQASTPEAAPEAVESNTEAQTQEASSSQDASAPKVDAAKAVEQLQKQNPNLSKQEAKKMIKELKIKFNGKEYTEELPFEMEDTPEATDYMRKQLQMSRLAQSSSQERAQLEKDVRTFIEELRKNPRRILSDPNIGIDVKELARQVIEEEIENSKKSPEQIEREKLQQELKDIKDEREQEKKNFLEKEQERLTEAAIERYDILMTEALEKSDLPKSPYVIKKMATMLELGLQSGLDVTPEDVLPLVEDEIRGDIRDMFATMPDEAFEAFVGRDRINSIRKKNIAKAKQSAQASQSLSKLQDTAQSSKKEVKAEDKPKSYRDFFGV